MSHNVAYICQAESSSLNSGEARCPACPAEHDIQNFK